MTNETRTPPLFLSLMTGLLAISFSSILIVWCHAPAGVIGMYRLYLSTVLLLPFALRKWRSLRLLRRTDVAYIVISGIFLGLHFLFWITSLKQTSIASSMIITALEPVFVMLGAFFLFGERLGRRGYLSMGVAVLGAIAVGLSDFANNVSLWHGDLNALLGTVAVALYMLAGQRVRTQISSTLYNTMVFFIAGSVLAITNLIVKSPFVGYSGRTMLLFLLLALIPTLLGHALFNWLLAYVSASTISMTILGEPVVAIVLAYFLLGEPLHPAQALGGALCLGGVWLFLHFNHRPKQASRSPAYPRNSE